MAKEVIRQNIVEDSGLRTYEIDGMRVTMPAIGTMIGNKHG